MIEELAVVVRIENGVIEVECETKSSCSGCASRQQCTSGVVSEAFSGRTQRISPENPENLPIKVGDRVLIGIPETSLIRGAVMVYLLPLLLFTVGAIGSNLLFGWPEWLTIVVAFACGVAGYLLSRTLMSQDSQKLVPVVLEICSESSCCGDH